MAVIAGLLLEGPQSEQRKEKEVPERLKRTLAGLSLLELPLFFLCFLDFLLFKLASGWISWLISIRPNRVQPGLRSTGAEMIADVAF